MNKALHITQVYLNSPPKDEVTFLTGTPTPQAHCVYIRETILVNGPYRCGFCDEAKIYQHGSLIYTI